MQQRPAKARVGAEAISRPWLGALPAVVAFMGVFLYVWLRIEPAVEHQSSGPYFYFGKSFFEPYWHRVGGVGDYLGI
ncbi:MAG TPA: hypothetical protein VEC99_03170, partial [Clostridia bacterium]|nr:hypothetical protein [Clostridia bacterium]